MKQSDFESTLSHHNMGTWKSRVLSKKNRGSRTPGKTKGHACQSTPLQRALAKNSRSYKHPEYDRMCKIWDGLNQSRMSGK